MTIITELLDDFKFNLSFRSKLMKRQLKMNRAAPKAGDLAPDFTLSDISGTESITLSDFRGKKPVALVFGSFT
jgi:peroxiredoxin